jgi:protein-disulfide isomerase
MRTTRTITLLLLTLLLALLLAAPAFAELERSVIRSQPLDGVPLSISQSVKDGRLFVLLKGGEVQILDAGGRKQESFQVGPDITTIAASADSQLLYLGNGRSQQLQLMRLAMVYPLPDNDSASKGPADAPVTITLFDDFQCPYCARLVPIIEQVVAAYPKQVRVVFKNFPLKMHKFARQAAAAGVAARRQGKFWPLHDQLFANYNQLSEARIRELAEAVGLDMARFDQDIADPAVQQEIATDLKLGLAAEVRGTPAVYINGRPLQKRDLNSFRAAINAELQRAK